MTRSSRILGSQPGLIGMGIACGIVLFSRPVFALEVPGGELRVTRGVGAEGCPDERELSRATLALGARDGVTPSTPLIIDVSFTRDESGFRVAIRATGAKQGLRELRKSDDTCTSLAEATNVVLAVLLDLLPPAEQSPPALDLLVEPPRFHDPLIDSPRTPELVDRGERTRPPGFEHPASLRFGIETHAGLAYGIFGDTSSGLFGGAARGYFERWEASAGILWVPNQLLPEGTHVVELGYGGARLGGCYWLAMPRTVLGVAGCAGALLGLLTTRGQGFSVNQSSRQFWPSGELALAGRLDLAGPVDLRLTLSAVFSRRHMFSAGGVGVVHETGPLAALAVLGPELRFQ